MVMTAFMGFPQDGHAFSAAEVGQALSGLVVRESTGIPRTGMIGAGPSVTAAPASWKVQVSPFTYVHQVSGAVQFSGLSAAEQVDILPAAGSVPTGQARVDVVCWDPAAAELLVVEGAPAVSPTTPTTGLLARIATVRVNAGDGMVVAGQVAPVFQFADRVTGALPTAVPGYSIGASTSLERDSSGMVDAYVEINSGAGQLPSGVKIADMPEGFWPVADVEFVGGQSVGGHAGALFVQVRANGGIYVWNPTYGNRRASFHVRYRAK